jgi:hypothetical protein
MIFYKRRRKTERKEGSDRGRKLEWNKTSTSMSGLVFSLHLCGRWQPLSALKLGLSTLG